MTPKLLIYFFYLVVFLMLYVLCCVIREQHKEIDKKPEELKKLYERIKYKNENKILHKEKVKESE